MADYLNEIVQKITTRCDISGFVELSTAIADATKKARGLSRSLNRAVTPEQKIKMEELKLAQREVTATTMLHRIELEKQRQQTVLNNIEYQKEINNVSQNRLALEQLKNARQKNNNETRIATQETTKFVAQTRMEASANRLNTQLSRERVAQMRKELAEQRRLNKERGLGIGSRIGTYVGAYFGLHTLRSMVETGSRIQLVQRSIEGLTKSTQDWQFIQQEAFRTGTEIEVVAKGYRNFFSSARMAGFEKGGIQQMYADLLLSTRAIGASTQQTEGALLALEQMISKGRVSMEELRRQLGNAIPGAFEIGAKAMNMTTAEFNDFVKNVGISSAEFVPRFIKTLKETYADGFKNIEQTVSVAQIRLSNSWKLLQSDIMSGDTGKAFAEGLNVLRETIDTAEFKQLIANLGQVFTWIVKIFSFMVRNWQVILILIGMRGFYGWLYKSRGIFRLLTMDIGRATKLLSRFGLIGRMAFRNMSVASKAFLGSIFRILAPLLLIEDILFFIGEKWLGWNTKSAIGAAVNASKANGNPLSPNSMKTWIDNELSLKGNKDRDKILNKYLTKDDPRYWKAVQAWNDRDFETFGAIRKDAELHPSANLNKETTQNNNISININVDGQSDPIRTAQAVYDVFSNELVSYGLTTDAEGVLT